MQNFRELRDSWALRAVIDPATVDLHRRLDQQANPHNDSYPTRRKRRSDGEIVSDMSYNFADEALRQQFGTPYSSWLNDNTNPVSNQSQARTYR